MSWSKAIPRKWYAFHKLISEELYCAQAKRYEPMQVSMIERGELRFNKKEASDNYPDASFIYAT